MGHRIIDPDNWRSVDPRVMTDSELWRAEAVCRAVCAAAEARLKMIAAEKATRRDRKRRRDERSQERQR